MGKKKPLGLTKYEQRTKKRLVFYGWKKEKDITKTSLSRIFRTTVADICNIINIKKEKK